MRRREWITISAAGLTVAFAARADERVTLHRRLKCSPGIATRDYQHRNLSQTISAISALAVPMGSFTPRSRLVELGLVGGVVDGATPPPLGARAKMFQFVDPTSLRIDHCSISHMAAVLDEEGRWVASLRADQNPIVVRDRRNLVDGVVVDDIRRSVLQTRQILRNRFHVRIAGYSWPEGQNVVDADAATHPEIFEIVLTPFWVQRGEPRRLLCSGAMPPAEAARAYALVDRIGIDFAYERQAGLKADRP
jgi:hypothetical protein